MTTRHTRPASGDSRGGFCRVRQRCPNRAVRIGVRASPPTYGPERAGDPGSGQGWDPPPRRTGRRRPRSSSIWSDSRSTSHPYRESSDSICTRGCLPASVIFSSRHAGRSGVIVPLRLTSAYGIAIRHLSSQVPTLSGYGSHSRQPASRSYLAREHLALSVKQGLLLFDEGVQHLEATLPSSAAWRTNPRCRARLPRTPPAATGPPRSRRVSLSSTRSRSLPPRVGGGRPRPARKAHGAAPISCNPHGRPDETGVLRRCRPLWRGGMKSWQVGGQDPSWDRSPHAVSTRPHPR